MVTVLSSDLLKTLWFLFMQNPGNWSWCLLFIKLNVSSDAFMLQMLHPVFEASRCDTAAPLLNKNDPNVLNWSTSPHNWHIYWSQICGKFLFGLCSFHFHGFSPVIFLQQWRCNSSFSDSSLRIHYFDLICSFSFKGFHFFCLVLFLVLCLRWSCSSQIVFCCIIFLDSVFSQDLWRWCFWFHVTQIQAFMCFDFLIKQFLSPQLHLPPKTEVIHSCFPVVKMSWERC